MKSSNKLTHSSILLGLIALLYGAETKAQFNEGDKLLNVGAGVGSTYSGGVPLFLSYEQQAFHRNISVGGAVGYQSWTQDYGLIASKARIEYTSYLLGIRASYHLNEALNVKVEELDLYLGLGLVYRGFSHTAVTGVLPSATYGSGLQPLLHFGGRYYLHKNIAIYLEGGWSGLSVLQAGVTFRF